MVTSTCFDKRLGMTSEEDDIHAVREKYPHARLKAVYDGCHLTYRDGVTIRPRWRIYDGPSTSLAFHDPESAWRYARDRLVGL